ncbi:VOC family protein [bacterium]|nr:VOC family protein [bacterium]
MINGIDALVFKVSDLNRACEFYQNALGLDLAYKDEESQWAEVNLGAVHLGLHQAEPFGGGRNPFISLAVDDLEATVAALKQRGVEFVGEVTSQPFGRQVTVRDPDGNQFELVEGSD